MTVADSGADPSGERLEAPLARLDAAREDLAKQWLLRLIERTPLEQIERLPTDRLARALPELIAGIIRALAGSGDASAAHERAIELAEARGEGGAGSLPADIASLQTVLVGALRRELGDADPEGFLDAVERLTAVTGVVQAAAIEQLMRARSQELDSLGGRDELTGLPNLRWLEERLGSLVAIQRRYGHPFALLLVDIEGLGRINAAHGDDAGDRTLKALAGAIGQTVREADMPARSGGDEFCVLAPQQTAERAAVLAARLAQSAEDMELGERMAVRVAIGVAGCPEHSTEPDMLLELADGAMFRARAAGEAWALANAR